MTDSANLGAALGMVGAILNCMPDWTIKEVAFGIWIISNCIMLVWAKDQDVKPIIIHGKSLNSVVIMYGCYMMTSMFGLASHLLK